MSKAQQVGSVSLSANKMDSSGNGSNFPRHDFGELDSSYVVIYILRGEHLEKVKNKNW